VGSSWQINKPGRLFKHKHALKKKYRGQFEKGEQNVELTQNKLMQRLSLLISTACGWTLK